MYCLYTQIYHILAGSYLYTYNSLVVIMRSSTLGVGKGGHSVCIVITHKYIISNRQLFLHIDLFGGYHEIPNSGVGGGGNLYVLS